jgi:hypothetical protein
MIAEQGKGGRYHRRAVLNCVAALLHDYVRRGRADHSDQDSSVTAREVLQQLIVALLLRGRNFSELVVSTYKSADKTAIALSGDSRGLLDQEDWASILDERVTNSAAAGPESSASDMRIDGLPHNMGRRAREACAVVVHAVTQRSDLAYFLPFPDTIDLLSIAVHTLRHAGPSRGRDVWLVCDLPRMRSALLHRLTFDTAAATSRIRCAWIARKCGVPCLQSVGDSELPGLSLLGIDKVLEGAACAVLKEQRAPSAILVDAAAVSDSRQLPGCVRRLRELAEGVPVILVAGIGDQGALWVAREIGLPMWVLRAGDAARLDALAAARGAGSSFHSAIRPAGADLSSSKVVSGIQVNLEILEGQGIHHWAAALFDAVRELERFFPERSEVMRRVRIFIRTLISLCVPWRTHLQAFATRGRVGPYAASSIEAQIQDICDMVVETGDQATAFERLVHTARAALEIMRAPAFASGKQAALLRVVKEARDASEFLCLICPNEPTQQSVHTFLAREDRNFLSGHVRVFTKPQVRRAFSEGTLADSSVLLPLHCLGFGDGFYFSGIASVVRLQIYDWEREAVEEYLTDIASDIHRSSPCSGSKLHFLAVPGGNEQRWDSSLSNDEPASESVSRCRLERSFSTEISVIPGKPAPVPPFSFVDRMWLRRVLTTVDFALTPLPRTSTEAHSAPREVVMLQLDDGEPAAQLAPETPVLHLGTYCEDAEHEWDQDTEHSGRWTVLAREVRGGDEILIPRTGDRDVLKRLLHHAFSTSAEYLTAIHVNSVWEEGVARIPERIGHSATKALSLLTEHGSTITCSQTITRWKQGVVVGPRHAASIRAVGLATDQPELVRHCEMIHAAHVHLRACTTLFSRAVKKLLRAGKSIGPDTIVDANLRICRADLDEFARMGRVESAVWLNRSGP